MKRFFLAAVVLLTPSIQPARSQQASAPDLKGCDGCALIEEALKAVQNLAPGIPRSKVEVDFELDGGLQPLPGPSRYVFKKCPFIKVEIEFTHFDGQLDELPSDQVIKVSRPYLQYPIAD